MSTLPERPLAPHGRALHVHGSIVDLQSIKYRDPRFKPVVKAYVLLNTGATIRVTAPPDPHIGDAVALIATFTRSATDQSFALGTRPRYLTVTPSPDAAGCRRGWASAEIERKIVEHCARAATIAEMGMDAIAAAEDAAIVTGKAPRAEREPSILAQLLAEMESD